VRSETEFGYDARPRASKEILRGLDLHDASTVEDRDAIGDDHRFRLVVGDVEGRDAKRFVKSPDLESHFFAEICIEVAERLVEQENLRLHDEGPRHGDSLLLASWTILSISTPRRARSTLDTPALKRRP